MTTSLTEVCDLFLATTSDFRLSDIYQTSGSLTMNTVMEPWLLYSIDDFSDICDQELTYTVTSGSSDGYFSEDLNKRNQLMLAYVMSYYWLKRQIDDLNQMINFVQGKDYKRFDPSNQLKEKMRLMNARREEINQKLIDYEYRNLDWESWYNQVFYDDGS